MLVVQLDAEGEPRQEAGQSVHEGGRRADVQRAVAYEPEVAIVQAQGHVLGGKQRAQVEIELERRTVADVPDAERRLNDREQLAERGIGVGGEVIDDRLPHLGIRRGGKINQLGQRLVDAGNHDLQRRRRFDGLGKGHKAVQAGDDRVFQELRESGCRAGCRERSGRRSWRAKARSYLRDRRQCSGRATWCRPGRGSPGRHSPSRRTACGTPAAAARFPTAGCCRCRPRKPCRSTRRRRSRYRFGSVVATGASVAGSRLFCTRKNDRSEVFWKSTGPATTWWRLSASATPSTLLSVTLSLPDHIDGEGHRRIGAELLEAEPTVVDVVGEARAGLPENRPCRPAWITLYWAFGPCGDDELVGMVRVLQVVELLRDVVLAS